MYFRKNVNDDRSGPKSIKPAELKIPFALLGGGVALLGTRGMIARLKGDSADRDADIKMVLCALKQPLREIGSNCRLPPLSVSMKQHFHP